MKYRHDEVLDLLDNANCLEDVQTLAGAINDYPEMFPPVTKFRRLLMIYADLFI